MKAKTIKQVLRKKTGEWLASITDPVVRKLAADNTIVTGGCIVSMLREERVNDFDVYFRNTEAAFAVAQYYVDEFAKNPPTKFTERMGGGSIPIVVEKTDAGNVKVVIKSAGIVSEGGTNEYAYFEGHPDEIGQEYVAQQTAVLDNLEQGDDVAGSTLDETDTRPKFRPVFISANAITLSHGVQLVVRFVGEPEVIHKYYDFVHCTCYWQSWDGKLELPAAALEAILTKELRYVGSLYPLCSIIRVRKFVARGWQINAGQILKMCVQLNQLNLMDLNVLQDQLTGVDAFYFMQVIDRLKAAQSEKGEAGKPVDGTYLMTIIDRIF